MNKTSILYRQINTDGPFSMNDKFVSSYKWKKVVYTSVR